MSENEIKIKIKGGAGYFEIPYKNLLVLAQNHQKIYLDLILSLNRQRPPKI